VIALVVAVLAAVAALGGVIWSGATRRRHLHYTLVAAFFLALAAAVWRAELVGKGLVFEGAAASVHDVHDVVVSLTLFVALALLGTGWRLARSPAALEPTRRRLHRGLASFFVVLVLASAALGTTMTMLARPVGG